MYFHEINILYFSRFSVQHFISELEAVRTFKQSCQKAHHDGHNECYTICPRSNGPIYIVTYYIEWGHYFLDIQYAAVF